VFSKADYQTASVVTSKITLKRLTEGNQEGRGYVPKEHVFALYLGVGLDVMLWVGDC
jgi:hypothetical protein